MRERERERVVEETWERKGRGRGEETTINQQVTRTPDDLREVGGRSASSSGGG